MDLAKFDTRTNSNAGIDFELNDLRTGKGSGAFIRILGSDSDTFQRLKTERSRAIAKRLEESGAEQLTSEEIDDMTAVMLASCTVGWSNIDQPGGKEPLAFSTAAAKKLYLDYPAIRDQINRAVGDRSNFLLA